MSPAAKIFCMVFAACALHAQCMLPEVAPGAFDRLTPEQLVDGGHYLRAVAVLEPLTAAQPEDARTAWLLSRARLALGDAEEALKLAETAVAHDGATVAYHVQLAAVEGYLAQRSGLLKQLTLARKAKKEIDTALELDPANAPAQWGQMMYYFAAPPMLGGDRTKAQTMGEQLAAQQPEFGRYYQGRLAQEMKDPAKAEQFYRQAILENPLSFDNISALANVYIELKPDQRRAERWACLAVHVDPLRADAWALLARAKAMCGCWPEAIAAAERAEAIAPEDLSPWYALARGALARSEQFDSSVAWLTKYVGKPPNGDPESTIEPARQLLAKILKEKR